MFLKIGADNSLTVLSKHFEMGQGVTTGLATMVAEELNADWSTVRFEFAPADARLYNNLSVRPAHGHGRLEFDGRIVGTDAQSGRSGANDVYCGRRGEMECAGSEITVEKSVVTHTGSGRKATLGELAVDAMHMPVPNEVPLKAPKDWNLIGTQLPRLDTPGKTTGKAIFALDIQRPGMLTAVFKRPDRFGAKVASFDATETKKIDGVVDVVQIPAASQFLRKIHGRRSADATR